LFCLRPITYISIGFVAFAAPYRPRSGQTPHKANACMIGPKETAAACGPAIAPGARCTANT
jgi:hypothetical protein